MIDVRFESFGLNARLLRPPRPMRRVHHHNEVELNYVFRGRVTYLHQWQRRDLVAGKLIVFWGAPPHSLVEVAPGTEMAWITLPVSWLLRWDLPAEFMRDLMDGNWILERRPAEKPERYPVRAWVREIETQRESAHVPLMLELQACFLRLAAQPGGSQPARSREMPPARSSGWKHMGVMARYMAEHFHEEIGVVDVAKHAGLHPKYAIPLFRRHYGITIRDYLQRLRIAHAQRLLMTTEMKMIDVALASGYRSLSAFYSCFARAAGMPPRAFRLRHTMP